jgi:AbrB family looped-hinge helix DNA binding protein
MKAKVSEKGQVTIPMRLRDRLGIRAGDVLEFEEDHGRLVARKVPPEDPVAGVYGILELDRPVDEIVREMRGE